MNKNLHTVPEAADLLALKPATIRAWILLRKIEFVRVGRAIRIPARVISDFIQNHTVPARERQS
jgi:excisionase family DNA binding protein